jgi:hypothetical protein
LDVGDRAVRVQEQVVLASESIFVILSPAAESFFPQIA